jgi:hypothetical protein
MGALNKKNNYSVEILGIMTAIALTNKIILIPFFIFFILIFQIRDKIKYVAITLLTGFILMLPVKSSLSITWFLLIIKNPGRWGEKGNSKTLPEILNDILELWFHDYPLIIVCFGFLVLWFVMNKVNNEQQNLVLIRYIILIILFTGLSLKDAQTRDFISLATISSVLIILIMDKFEKFWSKRPIPIRKFDAITLSLVIYTVFMITKSIESGDKITKNFYPINHKSKPLAIDRNFMMGFYRSPSHAAALMFGDMYYGPSRYLKQISTLYPNYFEYDIWSKNFYSTSGTKYSCQQIENKVENEKMYTFISTDVDTDKLFSASDPEFNFAKSEIIDANVMRTQILEIRCR